MKAFAFTPTLFLLSPSLVMSKTISERTTMRFARFVEIMGIEPTTYGLQSRRSSQLSYIPSSMRSPNE